MFKSIPSLAAAFSLLLAAPATANFYLSPDDSIKDIISSFRAAIEAAIAAAGNEARATMTHGYQLSVAMVDNLETAYADSLEKTFKEISQERQKTLLQADTLIHDFEESIPFGEIQLSVDTIREVISDAIPFSNGPIVTDYKPAFISPRDGDDLVVTVSGSRLNGQDYKEHILHIGALKIPADVTENDRLRFVVPRASLPKNYSNTSFQPATLLITQEPGSIWPWAEDDKTEFRLLFTILPSNLGSMMISRKVIREERIVERYISPQAEISGTCGRHLSTPLCRPPKDGFEFDIFSSKPVMDVREGRKHRNTSPFINHLADVTLPTIMKDQICMVVVAGTGCCECPARTVGHFEVDMVRIDRHNETLRRGPIKLNWGEDIPVDYDPDAKSQTATINLFNDLSFSVSLSENSNLPFLEVRPDLDNEVVRIKPDRPWE